ncbi:MAG: glyoxalase superfamily protein [Rhizobiaceae bacterium]
MEIDQVIPIFRMFDVTKAREFYLDYLGFHVAFEHRFHPEAPLYMGLVLGGTELHLSDHHNDSTPGSAVRLELDDIDTFHAEIDGKNYAYYSAEIHEVPWGFREVSLKDPFGNRLVFCEPQGSVKQERSKRDGP